MLGYIPVSPISWPLILTLGIILVLLFCSAFVSASEVAYFAVDPQDRDTIASDESAVAQTIMSHLQNTDRLLAVILILNNLVNVSIILLTTYFINQLFDFSNAVALGFIIQTVLVTFILLFFGEIMPKIYAAQSPVKMVYISANTLRKAQKVLSPFITLLVKSTLMVSKRGHHKGSNLSMDELSQVLELTSNEEIKEEKEMLEGIIKFGNISASEIMTARTDMFDLDISTPFNEVIRQITEMGYSRVPIYIQTEDNIKGILYAKDLIPHLNKGDNFKWQTLIRSAFFIPETRKLDDLMQDFKQTKTHVAIVVDEFGGTSGMVTMEDILEEIVGDINDEFDQEEPLYRQISSNSWIFEAKISIKDFLKVTNIEEDEIEEIAAEAETLAGMMLEIKGDFPELGEEVLYGSLTLKATELDQRRISKIEFTYQSPETDN